MMPTAPCNSSMDIFMALPVIDLRSDTVTIAPPDMVAEMQSAQLGDDVYGEDPTVNLLERRMAQITGKEAALFVASGTMGNLVSCLSHCGRGDEIILGDVCHISRWEQAGAATLGGISLRTVPNQPDGTLNIEDLKRSVNDDDVHRTRTRLLALENTWMGQALPVEYMRRTREFALNRGLAIHLDGARLFNAAVYYNVDIQAFTDCVDSVQICFSKGLCAPVGSVICGNHEFIRTARRWRKAVGGGMRQVGFLAAAANYALDNLVERLQEDHDNAAALQVEIEKYPVLRVTRKAMTNMVFFEPAEETGMDRQELVRRLKNIGILCGIESNSGIRFVTHYGFAKSDVQEVGERLKMILE